MLLGILCTTIYDCTVVNGAVHAHFVYVAGGRWAMGRWLVNLTNKCTCMELVTDFMKILKVQWKNEKSRNLGGCLTIDSM